MAVPVSPPSSGLASKISAVTGQERSWQMAVGRIVVLLLLTAVTLAAVVGLWEQWRSDASLSHGPLLLIISLGLLWLQKKDLRQCRWNEVAPVGFAFFFLCVLVQLSAVWADVAFLKPLGALGVLLGGIWFLGGGQAARVTAGPIGLLAWAIPWPTTLVSSLTFPLQLMSSAYAALFAGALGLSVHRQGVQIAVMPETGNKPIYSILVAAQCSGLTSLMVLLAFGYLVAYFTPTRLFGKILLITTVIPLALLANAVRLTIILLVGGLWSVQWAGWVHDNEQPVLVFLCSFGLLGLRQLVLSWLPEPTTERASVVFAEADAGEKASPANGLLRNNSNRAMFLVAGLLLLMLGSNFWAQRTATHYGNRTDYLQSLVLPFRGWTVADQVLTPHEHELLLPDATLLRQYQAPSGEEASLAVLAGHRKQTVHTPAFCMAGGGWNTLSEADVTIQLGTVSVPAVRAEMENHGQKLLLTYFFTDGTRSERSLVSFQVQQFMSRLTGQPPVGALVRVIVPIVESKAHAQSLSDDFSCAVLPAVLQRLREAHHPSGN